MVNNERDLVSLVRCSRYHAQTIRESLLHLFQPWGGIGYFIQPGFRVLLKPNLLTAAPPEEAVTTHPLVLRGLTELIQEAGGRVLIGDSSGSGTPERVNRITGIEEVIRETGAEQILFDKINHVRFQGKKTRTLPLAGALEEVDLIFNVAKLKTHTLTGLTAAVKNTYGCIVDKHKSRLHYEYPLPMDFAHLLLDIYLAVKPALSVIDAVIAMEGTGPRSGRPRRVGLLMAGPNGVAVDCVAASITGFHPEQVSTIAAARRRSLPGTELSKIRIEGIPLADASIPDFDQGAVAAGKVGRLVTRFPGSWLRNYMRRRRPFPQVNAEKCTRCGICFQHCPPQIIQLQENEASIDRSRCIRCYCCQELCPHGAIDLFPR